jgi:hypothetical protein
MHPLYAPPPAKALIFLHNSRCGGNSVNNILAEQFGASAIFKLGQVSARKNNTVFSRNFCVRGSPATRDARFAPTRPCAVHFAGRKELAGPGGGMNTWL